MGRPGFGPLDARPYSIGLRPGLDICYGLSYNRGFGPLGGYVPATTSGLVFTIRTTGEARALRVDVCVWA